MAKRDYLARHGIVRNAIREDLLTFAIPAILVLCAGFGVSAWQLVKRGSLVLLSVPGLAGAVLFVVGFAILMVAHFTLWQFYSSTLIIRKDHQLITHGVYRFVRHPIYLGTIMACIGVALFVSSLYGPLILLALIPIFLNRIRIEERLLTEEFGDQYRAYQETTGKLLPFIH